MVRLTVKLYYVSGKDDEAVITRHHDIIDAMDCASTRVMRLAGQEKLVTAVIVIDNNVPENL